ncbi:MAG: helix-turn-helix domain-containing protein [Gemmatimonadota bacterium]
MKKSPARLARAVPPPSSGPRLADPGVLDTKAKILDAAFRRLATEGYAALSVREIAKDAGVNHALINYHFRTKDQLVIDVLDAANRRLLERQKSMYRGPGSFARKWEEARRFYEDDLASGFVRVQAELWAASLSNKELRKKFLPRLLAWKQVVLEGVREALASYERGGVKLPPPFTPEVIASWIAEFWLGMEFADLLEVKAERAQHRAALDAVGWLLESLDARVSKDATLPVAKRAPRSR